MNGWIKGKFLGQNGALVDSFFNLFPRIFFLLQFCLLSFQHTEHKKPVCNLFYLNFWSPASSSASIKQVRAESVPSCQSTEPRRWFPPAPVCAVVLLGYFPDHSLLFGNLLPCLPSCWSLATPLAVTHAVNPAVTSSGFSLQTILHNESSLVMVTLVVLMCFFKSDSKDHFICLITVAKVCRQLCIWWSTHRPLSVSEISTYFFSSRSGLTVEGYKRSLQDIFLSVTLSLWLRLEVRHD